MKRPCGFTILKSVYPARVTILVSFSQTLATGSARCCRLQGNGLQLGPSRQPNSVPRSGQFEDRCLWKRSRRCRGSLFLNTFRELFCAVSTGDREFKDKRTGEPKSSERGQISCERLTNEAVCGDLESRRFMAASFEPPQRRPQDTNGRNSVPKRDLAR